MPTLKNMRRFERVPFFAAVTVVPHAGGRPIKVRSVDISLGGVGLVCPAPLVLNQGVALTFHLRAAGKEVDEGPVQGRVTHQRFADDVTIVGIEFTPMLDRTSMPALVRSIEKL